MALVDTTAIYRRLAEIKESATARDDLARYVNSFGSQKTFFLRYIAGWHTAEYYGDHYFRPSGDRVFDELAQSLNIV